MSTSHSADRAPAAASLKSSEPTQAVSAGWLWGFALAWFGLWLLIMLPGQFMLAKISAHVLPENKVGLASFLIGESAVVILFSVPILGVLCDRTRVRFGRRRAWALGGFITAAVPFALMGTQSEPVILAILVAVISLGQAAILVALSAMIADQVPRLQRGRASAAMGVPQVLALAIGMVLVTMLVTSIPGSWALIAALGLLCGLPFLFLQPEPAPPPAVVRFTQDLRAAISLPALGPNHAYYWALVSRVLIHAGNLVGTTYLLYFLSDVLVLPDPDTGLLVLTLVYLVGCGFSTWLGGVLSDRVNRRRFFVSLGGGLQAAAAATLALVPTWEAAIVAAVFLGLGFGMFLSVDQALVTDVLPDPATHARDLGIINSAQHIPIAPLVGWLVLTVAGYRSLYAVAAVIIACGAIAVYRIRAVR